MRVRAGFGWLALLWLCLVGLVPPASAREQDQPGSDRPQGSADFLFGRPSNSLSLRGSWVFLSAGSDLFDFVTRQLTLDKRDFNSPAVAFDLGFALTPRADLLVGLDWDRVERPSEYRDFVDNRLQPIEQTTSLAALHLVGSVRYSLSSKGVEVSRLAWIPSGIVPYVGAGGGAVYYRFRQFGDFVDFQDFSVFAEAFKSQGWAPSAHVFGGVDLKLYRALYGTVQARYTVASGGLGSDFVDFDPIDLSGFRVSVGMNVLF